MKSHQGKMIGGFIGVPHFKYNSVFFLFYLSGFCVGKHNCDAFNNLGSKSENYIAKYIDKYIAEYIAVLNFIFMDVVNKALLYL